MPVLHYIMLYTHRVQTVLGFAGTCTLTASLTQLHVNDIAILYYTKHWIELIKAERGYLFCWC